MTVKYWIGGSSGAEGDFATAANWSPSGVPADGDTIIFSPRAGIATAVTGHTAGNHWNCIVGSGDGWDQSAKNFPLIIGAPGFTGAVGIGGTTTFYGLACGCDKLLWRAGGNGFFIAKHASALFDLVQMEAAGRTLQIAKAASNGKATTTARCYQGILEFVAPATGQTDIDSPDINTLIECNGSAAIVIVRLAAGGTGNEVTTINCYAGGNLYTLHPFTTANACGGKIIYGEEAMLPGAAQTSGTVNMLGGTFDWYQWATINGLIGNAGILAAKGSADKTLGLSSVNSGVIEVRGATVDLSQSPGVVTVGANCVIQILSKSGVFIPQSETQLTLAAI
jgi:hypothetical protein